MNNEQIKQIHKAAMLLRDTIEEVAGEKKNIVLWGIQHEEGKRSVTGICLGSLTDSADVADLVFKLVGRTYNNIDYGDSDLPPLTPEESDYYNNLL